MIRIGTSGWSYRHWRGTYYPNHLPVREELTYLVERFSTVEVNRTFYSLGRPSWFRDWMLRAPDRFQYAIKGSRFITHVKRLRSVDIPLANFFASGVIALGDKLGPILWQLPSRGAPELDVMERFLGMLPTSLGAMADIALRHQLPGEATIEAAHPGHPVRHAVEIRARPRYLPQLLDLLQDLRIALVASHSSHWPYLEEHTADFRYLRLHGPQELYASAYTTDELNGWASRLKTWATPVEADGVDVFVYFDNDAHGLAPRQAEQLQSMVAS